MREEATDMKMSIIPIEPIIAAHQISITSSGNASR